MEESKSVVSARSRGFLLTVPLDASGIRNARNTQDLRVVARARDGSLYSEKVRLTAGKRAEVEMKMPRHPMTLEVMVGPADASSKDITRIRTIRVRISSRQLMRLDKIILPPIKIPPYYWSIWPTLCRNFVIRGQIVCPDGNPVPGARVCAYDVDWWWWWSSHQRVGCATTDETGAFAIRFRWCCGWWPWWWWKLRQWRLEPFSTDRIIPFLRSDDRVPRLPLPSPKPDLKIFQKILGDDAPRWLTGNIRPESFPKLRELLLKKLPQSEKFKKWGLWPWYPWTPWMDCSPDIIFKATQDCHGAETVIVDENFSDARWNISTSTNITLQANEDACCIGDPDDVEGNCLLIDSACRDLVADIGGNPPADPGVFAPSDGFLSPGVEDRPYGGNIKIYGQFGDAANVEYYEFEYSDDDGVNWNTMPPEAAGNVARSYWGVKLGTTDDPDWNDVIFKFDDVFGHYVIRSREDFEAKNESASWGTTRFWGSTTMDLLMVWKTSGFFADGRYRLRVKSYVAGEDELIEQDILPYCGHETEEDPPPNGIVLYVDNRVMTSGTNPNGQPCGADTVHICTAEPDTDFISVRLRRADDSEIEIGACGNERIEADDTLVIDFAAHDPDGHLYKYTLDATYGEDGLNDLLSLGALVDVPSDAPSVSWADTADQAGPTYADALADGATSPIWHGGAMRLEIPAALAFPISCCYQLELIAYKRTVVNCIHSHYVHWNKSEYSFMIEV